MPICIQYRRKGETEAISLAKLDDEICQHLGVTPDPAKFHKGWFDYIGLLQACGKTNEQIRASIKGLSEADSYGMAYAKILDYLEENFEPTTWVEVGRR